MDIAMTEGSGAPAARIRLAQGETLTAETGAMIAMDTGIQVETTSRSRGKGGGIMKGLKRMFSGESFFINHFTATEADQEIVVGPAMIGMIAHHRLEGGTLVVQGSSWLASGPDIEIDTTWAGFGNALLSGEGIFWVKCSGAGDLLINSFGGIDVIDVDGEYTVDTGHIVAFEETLQFRVGRAGGSMSGLFFSGEGLVCKFSGTGRLYTQTHNPPSLGKMLGPQLKPR